MSAELRAELIRKRYFGAVDLNDLNAEKARIVRGSMKRGKHKATKLADDEPLRTELLELFESAIKAMNVLIRGQATEAFEDHGRVFERYITAYARERSKQIGSK